MNLFKNLVYAHDVEGYKRAYESLLNSSKNQKYKTFVQYFEDVTK